MSYDLVIRDATIVDGLGGEPYIGDVAVSDGVIAAVGTVDGPGSREIDAPGLLVTPGFVDLHTHYDGQAIWSDRMNPSSSHGVTTAVMGNCGVGFAPCRAADHGVLVDVMAGVEDIPGVVMVDGLPWDWETFPQFLDALDAGKRDIDVAAYLPHSPLRVYVMGQRGADREPATAEDLAQMRALATEAIEAGALGFASSRLATHRTEGGQQIPSYDAGPNEILEIARGIADGGGGLIQFVPDIPAGGYQLVLQQVFDAATDTGLPVTFTLLVFNAGDPLWQDAITMVEKANGAGADITAQVFPRPIGLMIGLELTANPFVLYPSYQEIARLPLLSRRTARRKVRPGRDRTAPAVATGEAHRRARTAGAPFGHGVHGPARGRTRGFPAALDGAHRPRPRRGLRPMLTLTGYSDRIHGRPGDTHGAGLRVADDPGQGRTGHHHEVVGGNRLRADRR